MGLCGLAATLSLFPCNDRTAVNAAGLPEEEKPRICDVDCEKDLDKVLVPANLTPLCFYTSVQKVTAHSHFELN